MSLKMVLNRCISKIVRSQNLATQLSERKQAEKKLMESETKYRTLLENLPQKIFFKNRELIFVSCNENFARELNIHSSEIEGKTDYDFFPRDLAEKYRKQDADFLKSAKPMEIEECILREGQTWWTQIVKIPVKDESGEIIGVQGIFWDITDRKRDEEKLQKINEELLLSNSDLKMLGIENANLYMKISRQVENLENLVKDRTKDLETKNAELARMNKMFVGREIRMAELKKQIAELEKGTIKK